MIHLYGVVDGLDELPPVRGLDGVAGTNQCLADAAGHRRRIAADAELVQTG